MLSLVVGAGRGAGRGEIGRGRGILSISLTGCLGFRWDMKVH